MELLLPENILTQVASYVLVCDFELFSLFHFTEFSQKKFLDFFGLLLTTKHHDVTSKF